MEHDDIADKLFIMNVATVERLFALGADEFLLYSFYYKTAKWQKSTEVWANNEYVMKCLGWGLKKVRAVKESLVKNGFVEQVRVINKDTGKVKKWTIRVKYVQGLGHSGKNDPVDEKPIGAIPPPGQFKGQNNNNNKISKYIPESNNSSPILRNTIPEGNTITSYCPHAENNSVPPTGDILGDKRPVSTAGMKNPTLKTKPEDVGLVRIDFDDVAFGDWERLLNWFEYNRRHGNKVVKPYCKREFKQTVEFLKEQTNGMWFYAVDVLANAIERGYMGFGNAKDGLYYKLKSAEDYDLEEKVAKDFKDRPYMLPEQLERYKPMVLDLSLEFFHEQIGNFERWKAEEQEKIDALDTESPDYEWLRGRLLEKMGTYDRGLNEIVNKIKWVEDEKKSLKNKG